MIGEFFIDVHSEAYQLENNKWDQLVMNFGVSAAPTIYE